MQGNLSIKKFRTLSQIKELFSFFRIKLSGLNNAAMKFNDRQNELLIASFNQRRYNSDDIQMSLKIVSISRAPYLALQSYLVLPSIRTLLNTFASSKNIDFRELLQDLSPKEKFIYLNIDEVYVKPGLRFAGGELYGNAVDDAIMVVQNLLSR